MPCVRRGAFGHALADHHHWQPAMPLDAVCACDNAKARVCFCPRSSIDLAGTRGQYCQITAETLLSTALLQLWGDTSTLELSAQEGVLLDCRADNYLQSVLCCCQGCSEGGSSSWDKREAQRMKEERYTQALKEKINLLAALEDLGVKAKHQIAFVPLLLSSHS